MFYINLGITVLLVYLANINHFLFSLLSNVPIFTDNFTEFREVISTIVILVGLVLVYIPVHFFTRKKNIPQRLPQVVPGKHLIVAGLSIYILFRVELLLSFLTGSSSYLLYQVSAYLVYFAYLLIAFGLYKVYKSLSPEISVLNKGE